MKPYKSTLFHKIMVSEDSNLIKLTFDDLEMDLKIPKYYLIIRRYFISRLIKLNKIMNLLQTIVKEKLFMKI